MAWLLDPRFRVLDTRSFLVCVTLHSRTGPVEECAKGKKHFLVDAKPGKRRKGKVCVKEKEKRSLTHRLRYGSIGRE